MKKRICAVLLALGGAGATLTAQSEKAPYDVTIKADYNEGDTIYLRSRETKEWVDSAVCLASRFHFKGSARVPQVINLHRKRDSQSRIAGSDFVLDDSPTSFVLDEQGFSLLQGSDENLAMMQLKQLKAQYNGVFMRLYQSREQWTEQYGDPLPDSLQRKFEKMSDDCWKQINAQIDSFVRANPNRLAPVVLATDEQLWLPTPLVGQVLAGYTIHPDNPMLKWIAGLYETNLRRATGVMFTDFDMPDAEGTMRKLSDFVGRGQYVLVDFWASWCGPCRAEMPNVKAAYERFHPKGFEVVGISLDGSREAWLKSVEQLELPWPQLCDLKGWSNAAAGLYGIRIIPQTILFDPEGKVVEMPFGKSLVRVLEDIYGAE